LPIALEFLSSRYHGYCSKNLTHANVVIPGVVARIAKGIRKLYAVGSGFFQKGQHERRGMLLRTGYDNCYGQFLLRMHRDAGLILVSRRARPSCHSPLSALSEPFSGRAFVATEVEVASTAIFSPFIAPSFLALLTSSLVVEDHLKSRAKTLSECREASMGGYLTLEPL